MSNSGIRILICGDRRWSCSELAEHVLDDLVQHYGHDQLTIIHGGCVGVDESFDLAAAQRGIHVEEHLADWETHGRAAGPLRNAEMVAAGAAYCLVFHRYLRNSSGSKDCARQALAAGIPTWLYDSSDYDRRTPVPLRADSWLLKDKPSPELAPPFPFPIPDPPDDLLQEAMEN